MGCYCKMGQSLCYRAFLLPALLLSCSLCWELLHPAAGATRLRHTLQESQEDQEVQPASSTGAAAAAADASGLQIPDRSDELAICMLITDLFQKRKNRVKMAMKAIELLAENLMRTTPSRL